ncbi:MULTISPECIES: MAE_28990/MAE_18760 family HEPN-like nuclease [unclassified Phenylobacterium]|jgi:hypothetical protein|uniref:MAE_28990/MAE_18760 family HEPN-like nuclease n=1 Tax=unclassified Phenylobacterium TaxID=2640670 RepID=UPI000AEA4154
MPSPSLTRLDSRLGEVNCLIEICRSRKARGAKNIVTEEPALLRGAIVLLSSHLEGFFEDLVVDVVEAIDTGAATPSVFPEAIRARQVLGEPSRWTNADQTKRWEYVRGAAAAPLFHDNEPHVAGNLDAELHIAGFANPGTKEIKELFKTVGIADCWAAFHVIEPQQGYKNEVDAIVGRRNQIAHGDLSAIVTILDIDAYARNFRHTATVFSRIAEDHVRSSLPGFSWR